MNPITENDRNKIFVEVQLRVNIGLFFDLLILYGQKFNNNKYEPVTKEKASIILN